MTWNRQAGVLDIMAEEFCYNPCPKGTVSLIF